MGGCNTGRKDEDMGRIQVKYTGPAKPVPTRRKSWIDVIEAVVFALCLVVLLFDVFVWRA
jgi:hypothetical protein